MSRFDIVARQCSNASGNARVSVPVHWCSLHGLARDNCPAKLHEVHLTRMKTPPASGASETAPDNLGKLTVTYAVAENGLDVQCGWVDSKYH